MKPHTIVLWHAVSRLACAILGHVLVPQLDLVWALVALFALATFNRALKVWRVEDEQR